MLKCSPGIGASLRVCFVSICLILTVAAIYWQTSGHPFILLDDTEYITENPVVRSGLTSGGASWAFTTFHSGNWHPLTWLSHMADVSLFGMNPGLHHLVNVALHGINSVLLFLLFRRMTGAMWRSAFTAALFAVHPMHVESVAWLAERKDLLSAFFFLLTLEAYRRYCERPKPLLYLPVVFLFALGLLSKPMLVTLPFVLLLLDYWPLRRFRIPDFPTQILLEKLPLFLMALLSCLVTMAGQKAGGSVFSLDRLPLEARMANSLTAWAGYLAKTVWPAKLAVYYPFPHGGIPAITILFAGLLLSGLTVGAIRLAKKCPYLPVGWFWYLGTMVPVIGWVQVGDQAMADRYTYLPLIGLFVAFSWGVAELLPEGPRRGRLFAAISWIILVPLAISSYIQTGYWRTSKALFEHALEVTTENWFIHNNYGVVLHREGKLDEAIAHYREALRIDPTDTGALRNMGVAFQSQGKLDEALSWYIEALSFTPQDYRLLCNIGDVLTRKKQYGPALFYLEQALPLGGEHAGIHTLLGNAMAPLGRIEEAMSHHREAIRIDPSSAEPYDNLGFTFLLLGRPNEAVPCFQEALRLSPDNPAILSRLRLALEKGGGNTSGGRP